MIGLKIITLNSLPAPIYNSLTYYKYPILLDAVYEYTFVVLLVQELTAAGLLATLNHLILPKRQ